MMYSATLSPLHCHVRQYFGHNIAIEELFAKAMLHFLILQFQPG